MQKRLGVEFKVRSHVPGYCGYVPGARSENLYGKTYGRVTQESSKRQEAQESRFTTTNLSNSMAIRNELERQSSQGKINSGSGSGFWNQEANLHAFRGSRSVKSKPRPQKFVPEPNTKLTYEKATGRQS